MHIRTEKRRKRKWVLVRQLGGKCNRCGYAAERCLAAMEFHHIKHEDKRFTIGGDALLQKSMDELKAEAAKCELLCCLCHREHHYKRNEKE